MGTESVPQTYCILHTVYVGWNTCKCPIWTLLNLREVGKVHHAASITNLDIHAVLSRQDVYDLASGYMMVTWFCNELVCLYLCMRTVEIWNH